MMRAHRTTAMRRLLLGSIVMPVHFAIGAGLVEA
jgi:hypothetical protein